MKEEMEELVFEPIDFPRMELPHLIASRYRIYSDANNYTLVEAESALQAMESSGVTNIFRIQRESILLRRIIDLKKEMGIETVSAADVNVPDVKSDIVVGEEEAFLKPELQELAAEDEPIAITAPSTTGLASQAVPLSSNDIDKLVKGDVPIPS
jgi:hypothetical protein